MKEQGDIDKSYLYAKDLSKPKDEFLIKKHEDAGTKHLNDSNAFIGCSNTMDDVYENIDDYNLNRHEKILIVFDDTIADIMTNKKFQAIIKNLFIRCKKICFILVKMKVTDQLKILDNKIKANQAQYNVDRLAAYLHFRLVNQENMNI